MMNIHTIVYVAKSPAADEHKADETPIPEQVLLIADECLKVVRGTVAEAKRLCNGAQDSDGRPLPPPPAA